MQISSTLNQDSTYTVKLDDEAKEIMLRLCMVSGENSCQIIDRSIRIMLAVQVRVEELNKQSGT